MTSFLKKNHQSNRAEAMIFAHRKTTEELSIMRAPFSYGIRSIHYRVAVEELLPLPKSVGEYNYSPKVEKRKSSYVFSDEKKVQEMEPSNAPQISSTAFYYA